MTSTAHGMRNRWRLLVVLAVVLAGTGVLAMSGLQGTTVYYVTPSEIIAQPPDDGEYVRLAGQVAAGSVRDSGQRVEFVLTDGTTEVAVTSVGALPRIFAEGEGAVVEGTLGADDVFRAERVMVRHSNEYRARGS